MLEYSYCLRRLQLSFPSRPSTDLNRGVISTSILRDISLDIAPNDLIGLVGDSGAGKSQLIYSLARLNTYYGGTISCETQRFDYQGVTLDLNRPEDLNIFRKDHIGYIFQEAFSYFNPVLKLKDQLFSPGTKIAQEEVEQLMISFKLNELKRMLDSFPHQLSGGQLQRMAIVQCLVKKPKILVADEIDSAMDAKTAEQVIDMILQLKAKERFAMIWISHDQKKTKAIAQKIWAMEEGQLVYDGPAETFKIRQNIFPAKSPMKGVEVLRLESVSKSFKQNNGFFRSLTNPVNLLNGVSLYLNKGEIVGLIGASGSGKSTIAKIISGLTDYELGSISLNGIQLPKMQSDKRIIYVFQDAYSSLNPVWTVEEILQEALSIGGSTIDLNDLLQSAGLQYDIKNKTSVELSGGMRQRLALLRALVCLPEVLILDESLNAVDGVVQQAIIQMLIKHQVETKMAILIISHQAELVIGLCHRTYALGEGKLMLK